MSPEFFGSRSVGKSPTRNRMMGLAAGLIVYLAGASGFLWWGVLPKEYTFTGTIGIALAWLGVFFLVVVAPLTASIVSRRSWRIFEDFELKAGFLTVVVGFMVVLIIARLATPLSTYVYPGQPSFTPPLWFLIAFFSALTLPLAILFCFGMWLLTTGRGGSTSSGD